jgi:hypothetical protein
MGAFQMFRTPGLAVLFAAVASVATAQPAVVPPKLSLTVYNADLALVEEQRTLDVPVGRSRLEFKDVSASIRPETVALTANGVSIVEQNFDYDLISPAKLMEKAVGQQVQIVRTNPGSGAQVSETATVLSVNSGVVLKIGDRIEVLRDDGVPTRVIFPKVPDNLRPRPTLSVMVDSDSAGARPATLSYLTTGLKWNADYVAVFDERAGRLDLQGWITLKNTSGTAFADADTQLIAGDINLRRAGEDSDWRYRSQQSPRDRFEAALEQGQPVPVSDYYVYPLPERTTIANNQTKQVGFLDAKGVAGRKIYQYRLNFFRTTDAPEHVPVVLDFANNPSGGLGAPLPAGIVRVYVRDVDGEPKFIGEDRIAHSPQGSELSVKTGEAFDVTVQPTLVKADKARKGAAVYSMSYLVRNARPEPVSIEIRQGGMWRDGKVLEESLPSRRQDAYNLLWTVNVPANGESTLTATVNAGW